VKVRDGRPPRSLLSRRCRRPQQASDGIRHQWQSSRSARGEGVGRPPVPVSKVRNGARYVLVAMALAVLDALAEVYDVTAARSTPRSVRPRRTSAPRPGGIRRPRASWSGCPGSLAYTANDCLRFDELSGSASIARSHGEPEAHPVRRSAESKRAGT
jgi:hypothetical protein